MQRIVSIFVFCLALVNAQSRLGVLNTLSSGQIVNGAITNTATTPFPTAPDVYAFWVPSNAETVIATLSNTGTGCSYLDLLVNLNSVPCSTEDFPVVDDEYYCSYAGESFYASSGNSDYEIYTADDSEYGWEFVTGTYWYFGVRTENTYAGSVCSYTLSVNVNTTCAPDSVAVLDYNDDVVCYQEMNFTNSLNYTTTVAAANAGDYAQLYHTVLPQNVGNVNIFVQSTADLEIYAKSQAGASYYVHDCYEYTSSGNGNNNYTATFSCPVPLPGDYYITVVNPSSSSTAFTYTIVVSINVCQAGFAGAFCAYPLTMLTLSNFTSGGSVTYKNISEYRSQDVDSNDYNYRYFAFNTQNFTAGSPAIVVTAVSDNYAYFDVRTDNAPYEGVYLYSYQQQEIYGSPESFYYIYADYLVPNHIQYFGVRCYTSSNCNITISWNATNLIDITTTATTGTTTGNTGVSTTGNTGVSTTGTTGVTGVSTTGTTAVTGVATTAVTGTVVTTASASTIAASLAAVFVAALLI